MPRKCLNSANSFCYVCGKATFSTQKRSITPLIRKAYHCYFGCKIGDQDRSWAPHICCNTCACNLRNWLNQKGRSMPFAVPMIWREPTNHVTDCYFCMVPSLQHGMSRKKKLTVNYPNIPSATRPVPHGEELPIPDPPADYSLESEEEESYHARAESPEPSTSQDPDFTPDIPSADIHRITQNELSDLIRDLDLSKNKAEILASRLQQWNLLQENVKISVYRDRHKDLTQFFAMKSDLVFCHEINGLMNSLNIEYKPEEWRIFIDASKLSLKAVLLHNGNELPSIPVGYAVGMKESYVNMQLLLDSINYNGYQWVICGDLKVIAILLGMQLGYTKFCCFLCEWDSRARSEHYKRKVWPSRQSVDPGTKSIQHSPLVDPKKVLLPPLHIKLGLVKNFVKARNRDGEAFKYLKEKFPRLSEAKIKEGVFIGPQIRALLKDEHFHQILRGFEKNAWKSFELVVENFLGNKKIENYKELVTRLLSAYQKLGCNMSLKITFCTLIWIFPLITVVQLAMNMVNVSIRTYRRWKRGIRENGVL